MDTKFIKGKDRNDVRCNTGDCEVTETMNTDLKDRFRYVFHTIGEYSREAEKNILNMMVNASKLMYYYENVSQSVPQA